MSSETKSEMKAETAPVMMPTPVIVSKACNCPGSCKCGYMGRMIYSIFHMIMSLVAIYLSWKCNNGFNWLSFIGALFFPYIYIIFTLATKGTCGILETP